MVYTVVRFPNPHYIVTFKSVGESDLVLQLPRVAANDCDVFNYHSDGSSVSCLSLGNPEKLTFKWQSSFRVWYHLGSLLQSVLLWMILIIMMILMIQDLDFDDDDETHIVVSKVHFWVIWESGKFGLKKGTGVDPPPAPCGQCPLFLPFFL